MLVLTRRLREKIVFPGISATVQVMAVKSGAVRLGIDAPPDVAVWREEVAARVGAEEPGGTPPPGHAAGPTLRQLSHLLRDWLDVAAVGLALLRRQMQAGLTAGTLDSFDRAVGALRDQMQGMGRQRLPRSRVLLVEEDRPGRASLAGWLDRAGLQVATAGDGGEALNYLGSHGRPDVLLIDMGMAPPCDSPALVRAIRRDALHAGLKIFGVAGRAPGRSGHAGGGGEIDRWFNTPLDAEELLGALNQELAEVV